ncbi:MoxR family ATPase, partial [Staphylococcus warneri]
TLGVLLKHQDDLVKMQSGDTGTLLDDLRAKGFL